MGAQLAARALLVPATVKPPARLVLVAMALHAMDRAPEPIYYGGWDTLALALGYWPYDRVAERRVGRLVRQLTEAGYVKASGYAERTGNRVYVLVLPLSGSYKKPRPNPPPTR